jgi:hypothetical protein
VIDRPGDAALLYLRDVDEQPVREIAVHRYPDVGIESIEVGSRLYSATTSALNHARRLFRRYLDECKE